MRKLFIFNILATLLALGSQAQIAHYRIGENLYYQIVTNVSQQYEVNGKSYHFEESQNSTWYFMVMGRTDSSLVLKCTLLGYEESMRDQKSSSADSMNARPISSRDLELLCLLNRPFTYVLYQDGKVDAQAIADLFEARIREWKVLPDHAELLRGNAPATQMFQLKAAFMGDTSMRASGTVIQVTRLAPSENKYHSLSEDFKSVNAMTTIYSEAMKNGPIYDSAKMDAFFKRYDPVFAKFNFYKVLKMELFMKSNMADKYERYQKLLLEIPDSAIANSSMHLFNKAQQVRGTSVDTAYSTLRYFSKFKSSFHEWIQESYAQSFLPMWDTVKPEFFQNEWRKDGVSEEKIAKLTQEMIHTQAMTPLLLQKLANDSDTTISYEVRPLSLWVEAKRHAANPDSVLAIARRLSAMNGDKRYGNAYRYSLLVYKQLAAGPRAQEAEAMLDSQIDAMEKSVQDSTNTERNADRNMLAYAYKLKSQKLAATDSVKAENYLEQAATNSPSKQDQKAYASFYDRVFLDSKESYRTDYATSLIRHGHSKDAMRMISSQLNVDPDILGNLKEAFATAYPTQDFYEFFNHIVVQSWKKAPSFRLTSPDGKKVYSLEDYRGKWLLVDFWGTWCGPCREELPSVNAFVASIKDRKDLSFLSIACHDRPNAVIQYLSSQHFDLPASMSDGKVEENYAVPGYPCKYLISPDGTVLQLAFGQDWKKLTEEITALKPGPNAHTQQKPKSTLKKSKVD